MTNPHKILLIVDLQNDFVTGSLPVPNATKVVEKVVDLLKTDPFPYDEIIFTQDWHPASTTHFNNWPVHCVANTTGSDFPQEITNATLRHSANQITRFVHKGQQQNSDGYSAAFGVLQHNGGDICLASYLLDSAGVPPESRKLKIDICGVATDYCVFRTAQDLTTIFGSYDNVQVQILNDLVAGIDLKRSEAVLTLYGQQR